MIGRRPTDTNLLEAGPANHDSAVDPRDVERIIEIEKTIEILAVRLWQVHPVKRSGRLLEDCLASDEDVRLRRSSEFPVARFETIMGEEVVGIEENNAITLSNVESEIPACLASAGHRFRLHEDAEAGIPHWKFPKIGRRFEVGAVVHEEKLTGIEGLGL
jgi:hypothetical protein